MIIMEFLHLSLNFGVEQMQTILKIKLFMQCAEVEMDNYYKYNYRNKLSCDNNYKL